MKQIFELSIVDEAAIERIEAARDAMVERTVAWSKVNTGSTNTDGLKAFAPTLADAFSELEAEVVLQDAVPFETVNQSGEIETIDTGPILRVNARPNAPVQVVMSGHYDTVFPPHAGFNDVTDLGHGRLNGPGLADMKGGLCLMLEALKTFEASAAKELIGYQIVVTPDEEIGNFASAGALTEAASSGALIGMTYEPCMESGAMSGGRKGSAVYDVVFRCLLYTSPSPRDQRGSRMPSSA